MKDIMGRELTVGKTVVTTLHGYHRDLRKAVVLGFTPKKVILEAPERWGSGKSKYYKFPEQVALV